MRDTKPWYASVGVWGAIVAALASVLSLFKIQLDPALLDELRDWALAVATLIASGASLWGRVRATRRIAPATVASRDSSHPAPWNLNTLLLPLLLAPLCAASGGCALLQSPAGAYVAADRATFDAVAPEYAAYVQNDFNLGEEERARRDRTVQAWRMRIESAERGQDAAREGRSQETPLSRE